MWDGTHTRTRKIQQFPPSPLNQTKQQKDYIGHLLGHEGTGSIVAELKRRGWATAIVAGLSGEGYDSSTGLALFTVTATLTVEGVGRWEEVVALVYEYVEGVVKREGGCPEWVFRELQAIAGMQYKYQEEVRG